MRLLAAAFLVLPLAALTLEDPLSFIVSTDPEIRFFWGDVPKELRDRALTTGEFSNIEPQDYVGPQACEACHEDKYRTWSEHRHRWMNAPANPATVRGAFDGSKIAYFGGEASFETDGNGRRLMRLTRGELGRTYHVTQTIGSRFFQYYVGVQIEGPEPVYEHIYTSEHVLPFGYWIDHEEWVPVVHVEKTREGEPSLVDRMRRDPYADPAVYDYAQSCSQCHTTLPAGDWLIHRQPTFPPSPRAFSFDLLSYVRDNHAEVRPLESWAEGEVRSSLLRITRKKAPVWKVTSGVSCETCHYGNRAHVESGGTILPRMFPVSRRLFIEGDDPAIDLARNPINQNWTCSRCHIGARFEFAAGMGTWNSTEFSDLSKGACFLRNDERSIRCLDCHNPHVTTGQAWSRTADEDDALCLKCHGELEPATARVAHTRHPMGSTGSRCMNCHMPRINEGLQDMVRTHMIFSPTNESMMEANQPNACNMCHVGESIDWTLGYLEKWYGRRYSEEELARSYDARDGPATIGWLRSWHPTTQMVAMDVLTKAGAEWALPEVVAKLDSPYMLMRQFTQIGVEEMLGIRLADHGYRFYMLEGERKEPMEAIRTTLGAKAPEASPEPTADAEVHHFREFVRQQPDSWNAHYHLGNALMSTGVLDEAVASYRTALSLEPEFAEAENNLGIALHALGRLEEAERSHRRALELEPELFDAHLALGNVLFDQGHSEDAIQQYRSALELEPTDADAHYNLGIAFQAQGDVDDAIEQFREALRSRPGYHEVANNLGIALQVAGEAEDAVMVLEGALASDPPDDIAASIHNNLGWALKHQGKLDDAYVHFKQALDSRPDSLSSRVGLAWILACHPSADVRRPDDAVLLAESAAAMTESRDPEVLDVLAAAYAASGQFERARGTAEAALQLAGSDDALAAQIRHRLRLYVRREPYVEKLP